MSYIRNLIDAVHQIYEAAPPDPKIEQWIKDNKENFKKEYGDKWEEVLYAKAWSMYNESVNPPQCGENISSWYPATVDAFAVTEGEGCDNEGDEDYVEKEKKRRAQVGLPELGESELGEREEEADDMSKEKKVEESVASPEPCSAVGAREGEEKPKHIDVVKEVDRWFGDVGFRMLIMYPNSRPLVIPAMDAPACRTLEELSEFYPHEWDDVVQAAFDAAVNLPHEQPQFSGENETEE